MNILIKEDFLFTIKIRLGPDQAQIYYPSTIRDQNLTEIQSTDKVTHINFLKKNGALQLQAKKQTNKQKNFQGYKVLLK